MSAALQKRETDFTFRSGANAVSPQDFKERAEQDRGTSLDILLTVAFDKSWRFVEKDPFLAHNPKSLLRSRLQTFLEISVGNGERDLLRLANGAIWKLRRELE